MSQPVREVLLSMLAGVTGVLLTLSVAAESGKARVLFGFGGMIFLVFWLVVAASYRGPNDP